MKSHFFYWLVFISKMGLVTSEESDIFCKKQIVESYDLTAQIMPKATPLFLCPKIESSCCSNYDQFRMYEKWNDEIKITMISYNQTVFQQLEKIKEILIEILQVDMNKVIDSQRLPQKIKNDMKEQFLGFRDAKVPSTVTHLMEIHDQTFQNLLQIRRSFFCYICDY